MEVKEFRDERLIELMKELLFQILQLAREKVGKGPFSEQEMRVRHEIFLSVLGNLIKCYIESHREAIKELGLNQ